MGAFIGGFMLLIGAILALFNSWMMQEHPEDGYGYAIWVGIGFGMVIVSLMILFFHFHRRT